MISPVTSHSEVQEESHSIVQDPPQQRPDSGIEKYKKITTISRAQRTRGAGRWRFRHELTQILLKVSYVRTLGFVCEANVINWLVIIFSLEGI